MTTVAYTETETELTFEQESEIVAAIALRGSKRITVHAPITDSHGTVSTKFMGYSDIYCGLIAYRLEKRVGDGQLILHGFDSRANTEGRGYIMSLDPDEIAYAVSSLTTDMDSQDESSYDGLSMDDED